MKEEKRADDAVVSYGNPIFSPEESKKKKRKAAPEESKGVTKPEVDHVDFEKKLEESLKDL